MRVDIEQRHIGSYEKIANEVNKSIKKPSSKVQNKKYEKLLLRKDISAESKKRLLVKSLEELIISTFSVDITNIKDKKIIIGSFKANISLIRGIIHKIKAINNYLEEGLLKELGIIKESLIVKAIKSGKPLKYLEKTHRVLPKDYIDRIELTVYELMRRIVFFDKKLLENYKEKEIRVINKEKVEIKDLGNILKVESRLLDVLEAKMPPAEKVKTKLLQKKIFNHWIPMVFALLSSFEAEYNKEVLIFLKIKNNDKSRKKIEKKIKHVADEKEELLKMKEKRVLSMKLPGKISDDYRQTFQEYVSIASL